jgi:type IV fimbrial biogenesis protein FimT
MNEKKLFIPNFGFTLIELLIIVSIMGLLMTIGVAYYQNFNRRQIVIQAAKELKNNLRLAQSKALAGVKPEECTGVLEGYRVDLEAGEYSLNAVCPNDVVIQTYSLVGVSAAPEGQIFFKVLAQGVSEQKEITLTNSSGYSSKVIIKEGGEISIE